MEMSDEKLDWRTDRKQIGKNLNVRYERKTRLEDREIN
jgi:hypothetical protein